MPEGSLQGKVALVTGASRGVGAAVARRFAAEGAEIVLAARTQGALEEIDDTIYAETGRRAVIAPTDLENPAEIERLATAIGERWQRLDILVGNAGALGTLTPVSHQDPAEWTRVLETNLTANWHLIRLCEPLLKAAVAGRALFVTSDAASTPYAYWGAYAVSKAALEQMVRIWANENARTALRINLIDPGAVRTRMRADAFPGEDPATLPAPEDITDIFVELAAEDCTRHGNVMHARPSGN